MWLLHSALCTQPIVTDRIAWSVSQSVTVSPSESGKIGCNDRDAVCVVDDNRIWLLHCALHYCCRASSVVCWSVSRSVT